jgi:hypothetical protein
VLRRRAGQKFANEFRQARAQRNIYEEPEMGAQLATDTDPGRGVEPRPRCRSREQRLRGTRISRAGLFGIHQANFQMRPVGEPTVVLPSLPAPLAC